MLWTAPVGIGFGGAAVSAGKVYLLDRDDKAATRYVSTSLSSGKELWNFAYAAPGKLSSPVPGLRQPWMATVSTPSVWWEICTASTLPPRSLSGIKTSGRISAARRSPPVPLRPLPKAANYRSGESFRTL